MTKSLSLFLLVAIGLFFGIASVHAQRVKKTTTTTSSSTSTNSTVTLISNK